MTESLTAKLEEVRRNLMLDGFHKEGKLLHEATQIVRQHEAEHSSGTSNSAPDRQVGDKDVVNINGTLNDFAFAAAAEAYAKKFPDASEITYGGMRAAIIAYLAALPGEISGDDVERIAKAIYYTQSPDDEPVYFGDAPHDIQQSCRLAAKAAIYEMRQKRESVNLEFPHSATFHAIASAIEGGGNIGVSVEKFQNAFNAAGGPGLLKPLKTKIEPGSRSLTPQEAV